MKKIYLPYNMMIQPWQCDCCGWWNARTDSECAGCLIVKDAGCRELNLAKLRMAVERDCYLTDIDEVRQINDDVRRDWI